MSFGIAHIEKKTNYVAPIKNGQCTVSYCCQAALSHFHRFSSFYYAMAFWSVWHRQTPKPQYLIWLLIARPTRCHATGLQPTIQAFCLAVAFLFWLCCSATAMLSLAVPFSPLTDLGGTYNAIYSECKSTHRNFCGIPLLQAPLTHLQIQDQTHGYKNKNNHHETQHPFSPAFLWLSWHLRHCNSPGATK